MGGNETLPDGFSEGDIPPFLRPSVWGFSQDSPGAEEFDDSFRHSRWANIDPERYWNKVEAVFQGLKLTHPKAFRVLSNLWSEHVKNNFPYDPEPELYPFEPDIPPVIRQISESRVLPSIVDEIEPLVGVLLAGPNRSAILISSALSESERSAFLHHAYGHFLLVHIPQKAFYIQVEYRKEQIPPDLRADRWYRHIEREANRFSDMEMGREPEKLKLYDVVGDFALDVKTTFTRLLSGLRHK